jgi:rhodanese-related sulfurtransferase
MEVVHHVPEIEATDLQARITRGDKLVILDTRTPEEYQRFCIPGGRSVPGGELALRITDITQDLTPDTTVIINCAGRTRSIIGTRLLQRMGLSNVYGLKNGTSGWLLAGYQLETGANPSDYTESAAKDSADMRLRRPATAVGIPESCVIPAQFRQEMHRRGLARVQRSMPPLAFPQPRQCERLLQASELCACFPQHLVSWLGHGCPSPNLLISPLDVGEPGGLDLFGVLLLKTLHKKFCEFRSMLGRQSHGLGGEFFKLAHGASSQFAQVDGVL